MDEGASSHFNVEGAPERYRNVGVALLGRIRGGLWTARFVRRLGPHRLKDFSPSGKSLQISLYIEDARRRWALRLTVPNYLCPQVASAECWGALGILAGNP